MSTKTKAGFTAQINRDGHYHSLWINILSDYGNTWNKCRAMIKYHSNRETPFDFYGGNMEFEAENLNDVAEIHKFIGKLFKPGKNAGGFDNLNFAFYNNPIGVLERLRDSLIQVTNDPRHSHFVSISEVQPESFRAWRDDYTAPGYKQDSCTFGAVAENEDEARRIITLRFAEEKSEYYVKRMNQWLAAGRPVMLLNDCSWGYPKFDSVDDILKGIAESKQAQAA